MTETLVSKIYGTVYMMTLITR